MKGTQPSNEANPVAPPAVTMNRRGVDLTDAGRYADALAAFDKALAQLPDSPGILFNRSEARRLSGDTEGARTDLERALELEPGSADILHALGMVAYDDDDFDLAERRYGEALVVLPAYAEAWNDLGVVKFRRGDFPAARSCFEKAVAADPDSTEAWFNLTDTYEELGLAREKRRALESLNAARLRVGGSDGDGDDTEP